MDPQVETKMVCDCNWGWELRILPLVPSRQRPTPPLTIDSRFQLLLSRMADFGVGIASGVVAGIAKTIYEYAHVRGNGLLQRPLSSCWVSLTRRYT